MELKPDSGLTSCCTAECTLKAGATCRYVEFIGKSVVIGVLIPGRSVMMGFWGRVELKPDSGLTSCCTAECTLKAGATCRYVEYVYVVGRRFVLGVLIPGRSVMRNSGEEWSLSLTVD